MSEAEPEPTTRRQRKAQRKQTRRGRNVLKGTFALLRRDAGKANPETRRLIGAANITKAELQQLAHLNLAAQFRPDLYKEQAQQAQAIVDGRLEAARTAPAGGAISRWRDRKQGTKTMKAAYAQVARDVKQRDPRLHHAVGGMPFSKHDLRDLVRSDINAIVRRADQFNALPGRQQQQPMVQSPPVGEQQAPGQAVPAQQVSGEFERLAQINQAYVEMNELMGQRLEQLQAQVDELTTKVEQLTQQQAALQEAAGRQVQENEGPAAETPAPAAEQPVAEQPGPVAEQPQPGAEQPVAEQPGPVAEQPQPVAEQPGPVAEQPVAGQAGPVAEQLAPVAEQPGPVAEQPVGEQAVVGEQAPAQAEVGEVAAREEGGGQHRAPEPAGRDPQSAETWVASARGENSVPVPAGGQPAEAAQETKGRSLAAEKGDQARNFAVALGDVSPPQRSTEAQARRTTGSDELGTTGQKPATHGVSKPGPENKNERS